MKTMINGLICALALCFGSLASADICTASGDTITCTNTTYSEWKLGKRVGSDYIIACYKSGANWVKYGEEKYDSATHENLVGQGVSIAETISVVDTASEICDSTNGIYVEKLPVSWFSRITVNADRGNDTVNGSYRDEYLNGEGSSDTVHGNAGDDVISGGDSPDTLNGNDGYDTILGGNGDDTISGGAHGDDIEGGNGDDTIDGDGGDDDIWGDEGDDILTGGADSDRIWGGDGTGSNDAYGEDELNGGSGEDFLYGEQSRDTLDGDGDDDYLDGGVGLDYLYGGTGNDHLEDSGSNYTCDKGYP